MKIDHPVYAAPDLGVAIDDLERRFGVGAEFGGEHNGLGTHNALLALGPTTYLEVIAAHADQPASSTRRSFGIYGLAEPRLAGRLPRHRRGHRAGAEPRFQPGDAIPMGRADATGTVLRWQVTLNALDGAPVPLLIDWGAIEHPARSAPQGLTLDSIAHTDATGLAATLQARGVDVPVKPTGRTALIAHVRARTL